MKVFNLTVPPINPLRIGFIGVGVRGIEAVKRFMHLEVQIIAIAEVDAEAFAKAKRITQNQILSPSFYTQPDDWRKLCEHPNIDLLYISTPWELHAPMAIYAMECGKHVAIEVPLAMTVADCERIVRTAEATQRHCMMLENVCYDRFELISIELAKQGKLGELVHAEGAYIHDLRHLNFSQTERDAERGKWRIKYSKIFEGNPYPTHGIAPICQAMGILRTDRLVRLISMSSLAIGMQQYAQTHFGSSSPEAQAHYTGDMNITLLQTAKGKTIVLQHDATSPRPYSRIFMLSGTKGFIQKYPIPQLYFDDREEKALSPEEITSFLNENEHPYYTETAHLRTLLPEQKPMDIIMDYRLVHCLKNGLPLDQNVYDGALWSSLAELTQRSVQGGNIPVTIPDFLL
ncbi:oxidoreductase, NAD-binding domain protein [Capnocytophaga ochracea F0287]|uniref:Oxidoreductase, NAD-binding domain protein n=2 Tax=Capnocytophaga ochracea TaxID=1018 RepID=E4MRR6_CAPOC|nr:Gfo/Idh/MocA family oxidoreductase [Capnocytophaga ochracea]EFS97604.1 oxidoreductase, NAD-binding domain protein [Capnocytophaga ochracea F0287]EJF43645.1 oxidoreductase, NAD-binding domain protein [Capnocytophaga ochracea str. Holt 25]UEB44061.1 Gfo/Idh/MocA family oxidoreductase [Capnocytophaga ochracea]